MRYVLIATALTALPSIALAQDHTVIETTSQAHAHRLAFFVAGGRPRNADANHPIKVLINHAYAVGYSEDRKNPVWSAYHADRVDPAVRHARPDPFYTDLRTTAKVDGSKTFGGGFDRGHMIPNNAIQREFGRLAQLETFFMSNMSPQLGSLNRGIWQRLEHAIVDDLVRDWNDVWVIAGPIFDANPQTLGDNIQIPSAFFMVILEQRFERGRGLVSDIIGFQFPNTSAGIAGKDLPDFVVSVDAIEAATNLDFYHELADEASLETAAADFSTWFIEP